MSRSKNERRRLFAGLVRDLVTYGTIKTSKTKAKAVKGMIDKMVTTAKKGTEASYRQILGEVMSDAKVAKVLVADAKDRFKGRTSGYTRMISIGIREGDSTEMVALSFVDAPVLRGEVVRENKSKVKKVSKSTKEKVEKGAKKQKKVSKK
jgi:large subunit ribosomal protein L17